LKGKKMKTNRQLISTFKNQRGAVAVIVAILVFFVLIGIIALAVDIGSVAATKNELQNIADAAALAGAGKLGDQYVNGGTIDDVAIKNVAADAGIKNKAGGENITILRDEIRIGTWDQDRDPPFDPNTTNPFVPDGDENAVEVTTRRDSAANGPITTFFAKIFGITTADVRADATAALTGLSKVDEDGLPIPVGISKYWFDPSHWEEEGKGYCDQNIKFHPTGNLEGCAGWHTYDSWPSNAHKLSNRLDGLRDGTFTSPETIAGQSEFAFIGGTVASAFDEMKALYEEKKDPVTGEWKTTVVVYDRDDCSNPNQRILIVGFATTIITEVYGPPGLTIEADVQCDSVTWGRGGGGDYGTMGSIPGLVE
jgi:Flp pilus assembly protein TadG